jgi:hypothetical protein
LNPVYLFIFAAANEASITRWKDALISHYKDVTDHCSLRSLSHDLARLSRSLPARAFAIGPAMSSGLELSKHATIDPKVNSKLSDLLWAGTSARIYGEGSFSGIPCFLAFSEIQ